ncbi:MAG: hypothetical protein UW81_C0004G0029 [Candidatus Giovannonibacteria bacterium GW2011_GWC2_44_9]|uniref:VTC domain-containing protein n=3 Tax=Candidatus Giovannoniibacteriota TaxID=1752738 RepID=A0A0G1LX59_9BACT|nr:MAG: hypothetical protein UW49_C0001G0040 [Candidatus Giovannonibacteria bacterium GW2011_GWB1_44_23]KKT64314.1 MAG: hypothetical protein UW57_C0001G0041 [Candidatus Giovannonibacteria bacterium GW2011_GWA1_44_29]KKT84268.1 MAG: hypothetical protein UW81_C0004G0029 [Candidatus Giovannonibacteria bacterium GW2011_GWC2_44_9]KKT92041.1 MAG: VTC domain protein [Parcubacteria group bacterium GW2011_GWC1_45_13]
MNNDNRFEFKYVLDAAVAPILKNYFNKIGIRNDPASNGHYVVTSLYFDTPMLSDYYDKLAGNKYRRKLRLRSYCETFNDAKTAWLEIKEKRDMSTNKKRHNIDEDRLKIFLEKGDLFSCQKDFLYLSLIKNYQPHIIVRYKRDAYKDNLFSGVRLTVDSDLETCRWNDFVDNINMAPVCKESIVMEIKFQKAMPWWFKDMIYRFNLSREPFSKYTKSVDVLNRCNPLMR